MVLSVAEIVQGAIEKKTNPEKVAWLKEHDMPTVRQVLKIMYDKRVKILLPDTTPPYKETTVEGCEGILHREGRRLRIFIEGGEYDNLAQPKRESLFIALLEQIDPADAKLLCKMLRQKRLTGLPASVINEAYNNLIEE